MRSLKEKGEMTPKSELTSRGIKQNEDQTSGINNAQRTFKIALAAIPVFTFLMILIKSVG